MRFFSPAWHRGDMPADEAARVPKAYEAHVEALVPPLPASAQRLVRDVSLHDGLVRSLSRERDRLDLLFRAGDQHTQYFDARLRYSGVDLSSEDERFLRSIVSQRNVELLYDELDVAGEVGPRWIHRFLFWPYREVSIRFRDFDLTVTPASKRFDEGQDGNCCQHMQRQMLHTCTTHSDLSDCPDSLIVRLSELGEFGLRVHDGGNSFVRIRYCPWCGVDLWSNNRPIDFDR